MTEPALVAVLGGTFDPFHNAHQWLCQAVLKEPAIAQLRLIPCGIPALKQPPLASALHRLAMLKEWQKIQRGEGFDRLVLDDRELIKPSSPSYSLDTLKSLQHSEPNRRWLWVLGSDAFASLAQWHGIDELIGLTHFWVFGRPNEPLKVPSLPLTQVEQVADFKQHPAGAWCFGGANPLAISSRFLRKNPKHWQNSLPKSIQQYIQQHRLYTS